MNRLLVTRALPLRHVGLACLAAALMLPAGAQAGQIVFHQDVPSTSDTFGVMNEDGSGRRTWLNVFDDVPPSGGQRFVSGYDPNISADGRRVVFTTSTTANKEPGGLALGANAQGVNVWEAGTARRLSDPPSPLQGVSSFESDGVPAADGRIFHSATVGFYSGTTYQGSDGELRVFEPDGSRGVFQAACRGVGLGVGGLASNPVNPAVLTYGGCSDPDTGREVIYVGASDGVPDQVARIAPESTDGYTSFVQSPAWRPDGGRIVSVEAAGQGPSMLVAYAPDGSQANRLITAAPGTQLSSPIYVGSDRIAFTVQTGSGEGATSDIYLLPAGCTDCELAAATRLTSDGRSSDPSWSPAGLIEPPRAPAPTPTPGPPGPGPTPTPTPVPPKAKKLTVASTLLAYKKRRISIVIRCPAATKSCRGRVRIRTAAASRTIATAAYSVRSGTSKVFRLKVGRSGRRALPRPGRTVKVVVELKPAGARKPAVKKQLRLRR